jgi:choline dehydrogenase-like flavoprotein
MGDSAKDSVVDAYGRSHEVGNLWICDNSVFPSALAANPALTIMALALRTAERFCSQG